MKRMNLTGLTLAGTLTATGAFATDPLASCGADTMQKLLGQNVETATDLIPETARIIPPNSAVTQDYRPNRVNVNLDETGVITRIWCG